MSAADEGLVYEIHFDEPIGDPANPKGQAQHYIGHTEGLDRRLAEHRGRHTAAILRAVNEAGIGWYVVRTWPGTRDTERQIKLLRSGRRLCPECTEHPLTGAGAVARAAALRAEREASRAPMPEPPRPAPVPPYEAGREMGRQFMQQQNAAGRTAEQIEAAHDYITGPWHEMGHHTEDQASRFRGYTDLITAALGLIREAEAEGPHHEMEAETGPAGPAGTEMEEQMQEYDADGNAAESDGYDADAAQYEHDPADARFDPTHQEASERQKGAALAHQLIVRGAEAGRSAEWLAGKHEELLGQMAPDAEQTPAEREWLAGFRDEADGTLATLRDVERADAAERAAQADERDYDAHADRNGRAEARAMEDAYRGAHPELAEMEAEAG